MMIRACHVIFEWECLERTTATTTADDDDDDNNNNI